MTARSKSYFQTRFVPGYVVTAQDLDDLVDSYPDVEAGKGLSENDFTTLLKAAYDEAVERVEAIELLLQSDDLTLDQLQEIVTYIKANKTLIDQITTDKLNTSAFTRAAVKALLESAATEEEKLDASAIKGLFTGTITQRSGTVIAFDTAAVYGTISSPEINNITFSFTDAREGQVQLLIHQSETEPTFPATAIVKGFYQVGEINNIYLQYIAGSVFVVLPEATKVDLLTEASVVALYDGRDIDGNNTFNSAYAEAATITTWDDKKNAANLTQATAGNRPTKSGHGLKFVTDDQIISGANAALNTATQTWFVLFTLDALTAGTQQTFAVSYATGTSIPASNDNYFGLVVTSTGLLQAYIRNAAGTYIGTPTQPLVAGRTYLVTIELQAGSMKKYVNEMDIPLSVSGLDATPGGHIKITVGASNANTLYASQTIRKIVVCNAIFSAAKRKAIAKQIMKAFGL